MPYINVKVAKRLDESEITALKAELGRAISIIPGKSEGYLMVAIEDKARLWLGGSDDEPHAMVEVKLLGRAEPRFYESMTAELCRYFDAELKIKPENVYITYEELENWGWNGKNF